jgi:succinate-acetate transporter protein
VDKDVSAGSTITTLGHLALGLTLLAFGLGHTEVIDGVTAADAVGLATYVGGVALFVAGLFAFRDRDVSTGTAFAGLGALWFTWGATAGGWGVTAGTAVSDNAAGLFLLLFALVALSLTLGAAGGGVLAQATYGLFCVALVLLAISRFGDTEAIGQVGGWFAVVAGAVAWYAATAFLAHWPTAVPRRAAGRRMTVTG